MILKKNNPHIRAFYKRGLEVTRPSLKEVIEEEKLTLKKEISKVISGIITWVSGLLLVQTGAIIITLLK